jgi:predicted GIY-YIG superfamily endonuclease
MLTFYLYITYTFENRFNSLGVTSDLKIRINLLKIQEKKTFKLVYWESYDKSEEATKRENFLQKFPPEILHQLVKENNPSLSDLLNL